MTAVLVVTFCWSGVAACGSVLRRPRVSWLRTACPRERAPSRRTASRARSSPLVQPCVAILLAPGSRTAVASRVTSAAPPCHACPRHPTDPQVTSHEAHSAHDFAASSSELTTILSGGVWGRERWGVGVVKRGKKVSRFVKWSAAFVFLLLPLFVRCSGMRCCHFFRSAQRGGLQTRNSVQQKHSAAHIHDRKR